MLDKKEELEIISPETEQEIPPDDQICNRCAIQNVSAKETNELENRVNALTRTHDLLMKDKGFILLCACLIVFVLIYIGDIVLINCGLKKSNSLDSILDLAKTLITLLIGYVFASEFKSK